MNFCPNGTIISATQTCLPGYFCPQIEPESPPPPIQPMIQPNNNKTTKYASLPQIYIPTNQCQINRLNGRVCPAQGKYEPIICPPGFFCPVFNEMKICPEGYFCPTGTVVPIPCNFLAACHVGSIAPFFYGLFVICIIFSIALVIGHKIINFNKFRTELRVSCESLLEKETSLIYIRESSLDSALLNGPRDPNTPNFKLSFSNLTYKVGKKVVINSISGILESGKLTAIMGPTGCGKTTLLTLLTQKTHPTKGQITTTLPRTSTGYVSQDDIITPEYTCLENILFAARIKLSPPFWTHQKVLMHSRAIVKSLGLAKVAGKRVGGVSGGERKRVSVGVELVAGVEGLFLDEPTSGLDSSNALGVCKLFKMLAGGGKMVVFNVHQPRFEIFDMIDDLILMVGGGNVVYCGPKDNVIDYFKLLGYTFNKRINPADEIMDILSNPNNSESLLQQWTHFNNKYLLLPETSQTTLLNPNQLPQTPTSKPHPIPTFQPQKNASWLIQVHLHTTRNLTLQSRLPLSLLLELFMSTSCALMLGLSHLSLNNEIYKGIYKPPYTPLSPASNNTAISFLIVFISLCATVICGDAATRVWGDRKPLFWREAAMGYSRSAYFVGVNIGLLPRIFLSSFYFSAVYFFVARPGVVDFARFYGIIGGLFFCVYGLGCVVGCLVDEDGAGIVFAFVGVVVGGMTGFGVTLREVDEMGLGWLWRLGYASWYAEAMFDVVVGPMGRVYEVEGVARFFGYRLGEGWKDLGWMVLVGVGMRVCAYFCLVLRHRDKQK